MLSGIKLLSTLSSTNKSVVEVTPVTVTPADVVAIFVWLLYLAKKASFKSRKTFCISAIA